MMKRSCLLVPLVALALTVLWCGGCAYYNVFYNARQKFAEAERETERAEQQAAAAPARSDARGTPPRSVPLDRYRKVIETCAKLLEMYPKSKWVDDALLLMGVSYYRMNDLPRAERKFTELVTLFPNSPHVPAAVVWKARTLAEMKQAEAAVTLLNEGLPRIKGGPQRAEALYRLARLYVQLELWPQAVECYKDCLRERQSRAQRTVVLHEAALAAFRVQDYAYARAAFSEVARAGRDMAQSHEAFIFWSKCEAALGNTGEAEAILLRVRSAERFVDFADRTDLELAGLALREGRTDDAISMYERFIAGSENGEFRGLAFYRLADIYREKRVNLALSKAMLDSATRSGAAGDVADSARAALDQISKGLLALERVHGLQEQIRSVESGRPESRPSVLPKDSEVVVPDDHFTLPLPDSSAIEAADSGDLSLPEPSESSADSGRRLSPAELAADSVLKALQRQEEEKKRTDTVTSGAPSSGSTQRDLLISLRRELQLAYFHIAEFYEFDLADHDSALYYYRLAAADPVNAQVYWKANLFLADHFRGPGDSLTAEAERHYRAVLSADSVPLPAMNQARSALRLPPIEVPPSPQHAALRMAESAQFADSVSPDSALRLYSAVIALDSTTSEARIALFAKAYLFEDILRQPDSARAVYRELLQTSDDPSVAQMLQAKLAPPDSSSPFFESDEELFGQSAVAVETLLQPSESEKGWPPPEESLRGRRFR